MNLVFFEIHKVMVDNQLNENIVHWMSFLRNPNEERDMLEKDDFFKEAYEELERLSQDRDKVWAYEMAFKAIKDEESKLKDTALAAQRKGLAQGLAQGLEQGRAEGVAEGLEQGRSEGELKAKIELVKKMRAHSLGHEEIAEMASMSPDKVLSILQK